VVVLSIIAVLLSRIYLLHFSTDPENCHGMIILWSRYIVGQAMSLSLLASFNVSEVSPGHHTSWD